jgi:hypothetical protein
MRFTIALLTAVACFGQGEKAVVQSRVVDARAASCLPPMSTVARPTVSPATGVVHIFTDASAVGTRSDGGNAIQTYRWIGSEWSVVSSGGGVGGTAGGSTGQAQVSPSGSFAGAASIFSGGTPIQRAIECAYGTTSFTSLTAAAPSQEITIQTGISGNVRYAGILLSETAQFASATGLTVSAGRPGSTTQAEMTNGINLPLMVSAGDLNSLITRPIPPQITGTYSIVLHFAVTAGNVNAVTAGLLTWEVCGYAAR